MNFFFYMVKLPTIIFWSRTFYAWGPGRIEDRQSQCFLSLENLEKARTYSEQTENDKLLCVINT